MNWKQRNERTLVAYAFVSLWAIGFIVFKLYPILATFYLSFQDVKVSARGIVTQHVGWKHYRHALSQNLPFIRAVFQHLGEMVVYLPIILTFSLLIALLLEKIQKGKGVYRTLFFIPVIISSGPVIEKFITNKTASLPIIERFLETGTLERYLPVYLSQIVSSTLSNMIMILWFSGVPILMFVAGLSKLDDNVYEAASIDGATPWEMFWKITLPSLNPLVILNTVYILVTLSSFVLNEVIVLIQKVSFDSKFGLGYASALSWIYFVINLIMILLAYFIVRRKEQ